jgi:hypothetical protein
VDDLSTGQLENLRALQSASNFQFVRETITNAQVLDRLTSEASLIIHLAAVVGVKLIVEDPVRTIETNIMGTEAVLTTANRYGCKVLLASTSEVYGKGVGPILRVDDSLMGPAVNSRWAYATENHRRVLACQPPVWFAGGGDAPYGGTPADGTLRHGGAALYTRRCATSRSGVWRRAAIAASPTCWTWWMPCKLATSDAVGNVFNIRATEEITINDLAQQVSS